MSYTQGPVGAPLVVPPLGGGQDDSARLTAAFAAVAGTGRWLQTRGAYTLLDTPVIPATGRVLWRQGGGTYTATIAGNLITDAALLTSATTGALLTLAANPVVGAYTVTVTATTGLAVGGTMFIGETNDAEPFDILAIAGAGNPYTITLRQPIPREWTIAGGAVAASMVPPQLTIEGEGALWLVDAHRGFELAACRDSRVEGVTIRGIGAGIVDAAFAWDVVGTDNSTARLVIDGAGLGTSFGFRAESQRDCDSDVAITGVTVGADDYSGNNNRHRFRIWNVSNDGVQIDGQGTRAGSKVTITGTIQDAGASGIAIMGGAIRPTLRDLTIERAAQNGVTYSGLGARGPMLRGVRAVGCGASGVAVQAGDAPIVVGCELGGNTAGGLAISAGVKGATIAAVRTHNNLVAGIGTGDDATIAAWTSEDDAGAALLANSAAHVTLDGARITTRLRSADWHGLETAGTAEIHASGVRVRTIPATTWGSGGYVRGDVVIKSSKVYEALEGGTSTTGPTGTGDSNDGVPWRYRGALGAATRIGVYAPAGVVELLSYEQEGGGTFGTGQEAVYALHIGSHGAGGTITYPTQGADLGAADTPTAGGGGVVTTTGNWNSLA